MSWLIDTNIISESTKKRPNAKVAAWLDAQDAQSLHLSVLTVGELHKGFHKLADARKRADLLEWFDRMLREEFQGAVLPITAEVAERWGKMTAESELRGEPLPVIDALIAATAIVHGLTVVTLNEEDMKRRGAKVLNPSKG